MNTISTVLYLAAYMAAFLIGMWAYQKGFKDGLAVNKGKDIAPIITNPVTAVKQAVDMTAANKAQAQMEALMNEGINNLMTYTGDKQKIGPRD